MRSRPIIDKICLWLARRIPRRLLYWCVVQGGSIATTGIHSSTDCNELKFLEALRRVYGEPTTPSPPPPTPEQCSAASEDYCHNCNAPKVLLMVDCPGCGYSYDNPVSPPVVNVVTYVPPPPESRMPDISEEFIAAVEESVGASWVWDCISPKELIEAILRTYRERGTISAGNWPGPTPEMLESEKFEAIWTCIKTWDINVPSVYAGYCGASGNHVRAILDAIAGVEANDF